LGRTLPDITIKIPTQTLHELEDDKEIIKKTNLNESQFCLKTAIVKKSTY